MAFQADAFQSDAFQFLFAGLGDVGAAAFVVLVEDGATVSYEWQTDILKALDGTEQRAAMLGRPRQRYEFSTLLTDAQQRRVLSTLAGAAASAPVFLLGLAHEALVVRSATVAEITVDSLALCDWALAGQRIVIMSPVDGALGEGVVQSTAGAAIAVDVDLTAVALDGALIMPAMQVYLEPDQTLSRYPVGVGTWSLVARAQRFNFGLNDTVGVGATLTTFDGYPVWDRGIALETAAQPLFTGAELADLGAKLSALGSFTVPDWGRAVRIESERLVDWQWLKLFLDTVQGRRGAWLLPTGRPDLMPIGDASSGTLTVEGPPVVDAPDYVNDWYPSLAHRRLRIVLADGSSAYRTVTAVAASSGAQDLALNAAVAGAIERVEFLELVRLVSDTVSVEWRDFTFETTLQARVIQG